MVGPLTALAFAAARAPSGPGAASMQAREAA